MIQLLPILAQVDYATRVRGLRGAFQPNRAEPPELGNILIFLGLLVTAAIAYLIGRRIWRRKTGKLPSQRPAKLFSGALKKLGARLPDRILLRMAARNSHLPHPTLMLFSPELLERYAGRWADSIAVKPLREYTRKRFNALAERAFP